MLPKLSVRLREAYARGRQGTAPVRALPVDGNVAQPTNAGPRRFAAPDGLCASPPSSRGASRLTAQAAKRTHLASVCATSHGRRLHRVGLLPICALKAPTLLTVGYERHLEPASLVEVLTGAEVQRLLDIRELPLSRRRGFSKTALAEALAGAGITYEHQRALGNPKPFRELYKAGEVQAGRAAYTAYVQNGSAWAVDLLAGELADVRTCLLCVEHEHRDCHRDVVVEELRQRLPRLAVVHL